VVEGVRAVMTGYAESRQVLIASRVEPALPPVTVDVAMLNQILFNLLSNAVKFSPPGGTVELAIRSLGSRESELATASFEVSVTDHGIGIRPEDQELIFEEFRQVGGGGARPPGTGLGLALVRRFLHLLGGTVTVSSTPGVETTFKVVLPVEVSSQVAVPDETAPERL
jgi:two-component system sensor histidine kinase BarA